MSNKDAEGNKIKATKSSKEDEDLMNWAYLSGFFSYRETPERHRARCAGKGKYCACGHVEGTHHCNRRIV